MIGERVSIANRPMSVPAPDGHDAGWARTRGVDVTTPDGSDELDRLSGWSDTGWHSCVERHDPTVPPAAAAWRPRAYGDPVKRCLPTS